MRGLLIVTKPQSGFVDTDREYGNKKVALAYLSFNEKILAKKEIPLSNDAVTEITIAGVPFKFFVADGKLFYSVGLPRLFYPILDKLRKKGIETYRDFITIPIKKGWHFYEMGSIDGMNIYLLLEGK
jgi:hypothetical protein